MHEHHQVEKIVKDVLALSKQKDLPLVRKVTIAMGDLLGFDDLSVQLYFENFTEGTIAENAELVIKHIPGKLHCPKCNVEFVKVRSNLSCPGCGEQGVPSDKGKEFFVEKIE